MHKSTRRTTNTKGEFSLTIRPEHPTMKADQFIEVPNMQNITLKPERIAALELYAQQHGKEPAEVLDDALAKFFDYETWFPDAVDKGLAAADSWRVRRARRGA